MAVRSPLSSPSLFKSVSVGVAKNPVASWDARPIACVPALTFRAGMSLSFVLLTPPAAPGSQARSQAPCFCMISVCSGVMVFSLLAHALPSFWFQSSLSVCSGALVFSLYMHVLLSTRFLSGSSECSGALVFSLVTRVPRLMVSVCSLAGTGP